MANTTNMAISESDGWVEVASNATIIRVKANSGNWKSWRIYFSESGTPTDKEVGELYNGNISLEFKSYTGALYLMVVDETIDFSITQESEEVS